MKRFFIQTAILLLLAHPTLEGARASPQQQPQQMTYEQTLYQEVLRQEERAAYYLTLMQKNPDFSGKFREAEKMLEVKEILYKNFAQSPAMSSPAVRAMLLGLMQKERIEARELIALQKTVNEELHRQ